MSTPGFHLFPNTPAGGTATGEARRKTKSVTPKACPQDISKVSLTWTF